MPDYMFLLESRLSPEQRAAMMRVQELSAALGLNVYLTGGTVRDLVTGASLRDLDFTVEGNPSKIAHELEKGVAKILHEDDKLRHVELLFAGDCEGSISAARDDHYVRPGTRPEIRWSTIMEDLRRRDFSLNAIAISLNPASRRAWASRLSSARRNGLTWPSNAICSRPSRRKMPAASFAPSPARSGPP